MPRDDVSGQVMEVTRNKDGLLLCGDKYLAYDGSTVFTTVDLNTAGMCSRGVRIWFRNRGFSWSDFITKQKGQARLDDMGERQDVLERLFVAAKLREQGKIGMSETEAK